jgi:hypothetical protein
MKTKSNPIQTCLLGAAMLPAASLLLLPQTATAQQWSTNELPPGIIAWWQAEGNMLDTVGGHNGVGDSPPTYASGRFGQAWDFDGISQSVQIPNVYSDLDGWTQFTLEAWVNFDSFPAAPGNGYSIFSKVGTPSRAFDLNFGYQFGFTLNASQMFCQFNQTGQLWPGYQTLGNVPVAVTTNVWVHAAATYDNNAVTLYLNGVPLVTNIIGPVTIAPTSSTLRISKDDNDNVPFPGRIDDPRIYNRALSAAEIAYLYAGPDLPVTQGLKLHLDACNANGDGSNPTDGDPILIWHDLSGLGNDAAAPTANAPVYRASAVNGRGGIDFSLSSTDYLATAYTANFNFTNCTIFMVGNGANQAAHVSISAANVSQEFLIYDKGIYHESEFYHWACRNHQDSPSGFYFQAALFGTSSDDLANYLDGVLSTTPVVHSSDVGEAPGVADYVQINRQATIGWRNNPTLENFGGVICEVLVYDHQLDAGELDAMDSYLAGKYNLAVTPVPPVLLLASVSGGTVTLQWASTAGRQYQIQSTTSLSPASWTNEGAPVSGTDGTLTNTLTVGADQTRFFRLQVFGN